MVRKSGIQDGGSVELNQVSIRKWGSVVLLMGFLSVTLSLFNLQTISAASSHYAPPLPVDLAPGNGSVRVSWPGFIVDANYVSQYRVEASPGGASCSAAISVDTCTVYGLTNGTAYTFAVYVVAVRGFNGPATIAGPAWPCCSVPDAPVNLQAVAEQGAVILSWSPPANAQAAGHDFTYTALSSLGSQECTTRETSCRIDGLQNGIGYQFRVSASNSQGVGVPAIGAMITPIGPPNAPTNIRVFLEPKGEATVSWIGPANTGGLVVNRYVATAIPGGATCQTSGSLACTIKGLSNGKPYQFVVTAYNTTGAGPQSTRSDVAKPLAGPGKPLAINAKLIRGTAQVSWKQPQSTGGLPITHYIVRSSPDGQTCKTKQMTCALTGLGSNTIYIFTVEAHNKKGPGLPGQSGKYTTWSLSEPAKPVVPAKPDKPEPELS